MLKIKDRETLAIVSGIIGLVGMTLVDGISRRARISKRSYREAAAGMFLSKSQAKSVKGQALGLIMNSAVSIIGANYIIKRLTQSGRDKLVTKGIVSGTAIGAIATAIPNVVPKNRVKPKDAASNLSYVASNIVYGMLATIAAAIFGHDSLFDAPPQNDYLKPTDKTSEQVKLAGVVG
ncbi:MAG: hypothetical protein FNP40_02790 [Dehalobacter sp. 4CP]|nr:hypothetical protein [Dehalobacter sp. 4CP]